MSASSTAKVPRLAGGTLVLLLAIVAAALTAALWAGGAPARQALAAGAVLFAMACWASDALPELTAGLLFFALATLLGLAAPAIVFSGFASSAFWLVLSGMVVAQAMTRTGLGARIAGAIASPLSGSYARLIAGTVLIAYALSFLMPSNIGRITLLMPIMLALADRLGLREGRPGRVGVVLAVGFGTFVLSTSILPANVPNLVMAGAIETVHGVHLGYLDYLVLHAPVLGVLKSAVLVVLICRLFPDEFVAAPVAEKEEPRPPMSPPERRLAVVLGMTLILWLTEPWHGIAPAWVGVAAGAVCLLPRVGVVGPDAFNAVNHRTTFYVAALLGVVAVVADTGLDAAFGRLVLSVLPAWPGQDAFNVVLLTLLAIAISLVASANAVGAIYTAMASDLAAVTGLPLMTVLMVQVIGFSTVLFPYQAPPIVVAIGLGNVTMREATRLSLSLALISVLALLPLNILWWRLLGAL